MTDITLKGLQGINKKHLQTLVFLLILPLANLLFATTIMYDIGNIELKVILHIALRLWLIFGLTWLVLSTLEQHLPILVNTEKFWQQLLLHTVIVVGFATVLSPLLAPSINLQAPGSLIGPKVVVMLEITLYLIVVRLLRQQQQAFVMALNLNESELNMLRSQSNPHFLFNTLNLIASEIAHDPDKAQEIVYDLSDLMRGNMKMAQQSQTSLAEETKLVKLYLNLQQKRFKERLSFDIQIQADANTCIIPALLLQPVVENAIKYAVAPYADKAHITVEAYTVVNKLTIQVKDSGPAFDDSNIKEGDGFRILRQTLDLQYASDYKMHLKSTESGGIFSLQVPLLK